MSKKYRTIGMHTRMERGELKIYEHNSLIVPTKYELAAFPHKFIPEEEYVPEKQEIVKEEEELAPEIDRTRLEELFDYLKEMIASDEYVDEVEEEAKRFLAIEATTQEEVDSLVNQIEKFIDELE